MATFNVVRKKTNRVNPVIKFHFDYWLLLAVGGLVVVGMLMVYSTTFDYGLRLQDDPTYYFRRQFMALVLGVGAIIFTLQFDYHVLRRFSLPIMAVTLLGLLAVLFFAEVSETGAQRGLYSQSYQPSEVAKLATIMYIAHWLSSKGDRIKLLSYGLLPFSVITGVVCALIVRQPDLSTALLVALVAYTLFFIAGADWRQFAIGGIVGMVVFGFLMVALPHAAYRIDSYRAMLSDLDQAHWQVQQALIAMGRGGLTGVGLGESIQKFGALPFAHTDSVFAVLGEELGLFGNILVLGLFVLFVWRGFLTATRARDSYGFLLALGIVAWLSYQALINIAVITAVIPFTGIPLPFISYGGSSLAVSLAGVGILLSISRDQALTGRHKPSKTQKSRQTAESRRAAPARRRRRSES